MALERITQKDWYKILGAKPSDSPGELKRKYQRLALLVSMLLLFEMCKNNFQKP